MLERTIAYRRLYNQQLEQTHLGTPAEVVTWLGAVQAQEYPHAKWGLALRLPEARDEDIERVFNEGKILRTHLMRPTWHFVTPQDIRWLLALTAPRVHALSAKRYRDLELDERTRSRSNEVLAQALLRGKHLTRTEMATVLHEAGITTGGQRMAYLLMNAELDGVICSGARHGKHHTYALLEERVPPVKALGSEEALAEMVKRFFTSHGPAQLKDFAWWSGLTQADAKAGIQMLKPLLVEEIFEGKSFWLNPDMPYNNHLEHSALLLPVYDEYGIAYKSHHGLLDPQHIPTIQADPYGGSIALRGELCGFWKRTLEKEQVAIQLKPWRPFTAAEKADVEAAAQRYGKFLGMPVVVE